MSLFNSPDEQLRKQRLKEMEDKRVAFAERLRADGFAPKEMLLISTERGGYVGLSRANGALYALVSPDFGSEQPFALEKLDPAAIRREEIEINSEGFGGIFGFGKKGATGFRLTCDRPDGTALALEVVTSRTSCLRCNVRKNPVLSTARRRGDANVYWELLPLDRRGLANVSRCVEELLKG